MRRITIDGWLKAQKQMSLNTQNIRASGKGTVVEMYFKRAEDTLVLHPRIHGCCNVCS